MFPGMGGGGRGGLNPRKLNQMMRQMGIELEDIDDVEEVVIRTADKEIVFRDAEVSKMTAQGQVTWQIVGTAEERARGPVKLEISDEDVELVATQANVSKEEARKALEEANGQPAEALVKLLGEE